ncbi:hypothetical protein AB0L74_10295 [Streptomyces sp. NPDC052020]|uniref:hypothetical protein n=1 Tax=Streptomyces sp. NPDC052020 TaxID=3155677 RepID=UPI0034487404
MAAKKTVETVETVEVAPDADAGLAAAEAEAAEAPVKVEHNGKTYTLPAPLDYPVDVVFAENDFEAVRTILGEAQWQTYRSTKPTIRDFREFNEKINTAAGN